MDFKISFFRLQVYYITIILFLPPLPLEATREPLGLPPVLCHVTYVNKEVGCVFEYKAPVAVPSQQVKGNQHYRTSTQLLFTFLSDLTVCTHVFEPAELP